MEDAIFSFKVAGFLFVALVVLLVMFERLMRAIPFGVALAEFAFVPCILHVILGCYYWIEASDFSEDTQTTLKYVTLGVVFTLVLAFAIWTEMADK